MKLYGFAGFDSDLSNVLNCVDRHESIDHAVTAARRYLREMNLVRVDVSTVTALRETTIRMVRPDGVKKTRVVGYGRNRRHGA